MQIHPVLQLLLMPASWGYGLATGIRNWLFDIGLLKSFNSDIPVIVVGNLVAGGTGKTPVVAWLAQELGQKYRIAILSRGYGRRSKGFHLADQAPSPEIIGDEPAELRMLLPGTLIAVDRHRRRGIKKLTSGLFGKLDLILMDDGFQHRRIKPGFALILDSAYRPMAREKLLPAGLRR
ncbi:MAG: tetraacyldisaccharide 4'-kinase, partial [Bacteroidetes bacterium GWF2_49_14]